MRASYLVTVALCGCSSAGFPSGFGPDGAGDMVSNDRAEVGRVVDAGVDSSVTADGRGPEVLGMDMEPASAQPMCDAVAHLRLWVLVEPITARELAGSAVRIENGVPFLAIDGTCSFWVSGGWREDALGRDREIRHGTLAPNEVRSLEEAVFFQDVPSLADCPTYAGAADVSIRAIRTSGSYARCPSAGVRFDAAWSVVESLAKVLWDEGAAMEGPLHVSAVPANGDSRIPPYAWPATVPMASVLIAQDGSLFKSGVSHLVDDPSTTELLRALRARYLSERSAQPGMFIGWDGLRAADDKSVALVYMRDAVPYEDVSGLLQF